MIFSALEEAVKLNCSDVHISAEGIAFRRQKALEKYSMEVVSGNCITDFLAKVIGEKFKECEKRLDNRLDFDFSFMFSGRRWRANISRYMRGYTLVCRLLSDKIETVEKLNLPLSLHRIMELKNGLVLVTGATGSGKSTTLASIIEEINQNKPVNILTIEDPIEYVYQNKTARIIQKEVGTDVASFDAAIVSAMRQDPDVILIGEMRDLNTIRSAITLAETGHLVLATLHCKSVFEAVERIVNVFPAGEQEHIRTQFAGVIKMIIQQNLVNSSFGGVVPINEVVYIDTTFATMLKEHKNINNMRDMLRSKADKGNVHLVENIKWHIAEGRLKKEDVSGEIELEDMALINAAERR